MAGPAETTTEIVDLARIFDRHLDARGLAANTRRAYRDAIDALVAYLGTEGRPTTVQSVTRHDLEGWLIFERDHHSPGTAASRYGGIVQLFKFAVDNDEIARSPAAGVPKPRVAEVPPPVLSADQIDAVLRACAGRDFVSRRDTALLRLLLTSGLRRAEIMGLRWTPDDPATNDVDLVQGTLRVIRKGGRTDVVAIGSREAALALEWYMRVRAGHPSAHLSALWLGRAGALGPTGLAQMLADRGVQAHLPFRLRPHLMRHTFAATWLAAGGTETGLMRAAGWRSRAMLNRYGAATADERSREEARKLRIGDRR